MKPTIKCIHPLLLLSLAGFGVLCLAWPDGIHDLFGSRQVGPCTFPMAALFVIPLGFTFLLGLGFSAIRVFVLIEDRRKAKEQNHQ